MRPDLRERPWEAFWSMSMSADWLDLGLKRIEDQPTFIGFRRLRLFFLLGCSEKLVRIV